MNAKNISKSLTAKLNDWVNSITDGKVQKAIRKDAIVTGGAIVSLLNNEKPNDYDIYFKTYSTCMMVAQYYMNIWNSDSTKSKFVEFDRDAPEGRVMLVISNSPSSRGDGFAGEEDEKEYADFNSGMIDDDTEPYATENDDENPTEPNPDIKEPKYRPRYFTTNAISLSDGIQLVIRFIGSVEDIHTNYDFEHTKCSFDYETYTVNLPNKSLECIINKELVYSGSKYPLCSIIRTRKFIARGWKINAGQYVKMALELNELDLKDIRVFKEQLVGVDSAYFSAVIDYIEARAKKDPEWTIDNRYLFEIINKIF